MTFSTHVVSVRIMKITKGTRTTEEETRRYDPLQDKPKMFYERLHEALDLLVKFFHADERGLPLEVLRRQSFMNAEERLQYHKMDTTFLIDRYYQQRLLVCEARVVAQVNRRTRPLPRFN